MDPPGYRYAESTSLACHFWVSLRDVKRWATCARYGCRTYLDSVCDSFEPLGIRERAMPTSEELRRLDGPWMKYPPRK